MGTAADESREDRSLPEPERRVRDQEPLATVRAFPRRFAWGLPLVLLVPIAVGLFLAEESMARAVALQLFLQTAGLLWLYVPAYRRRYVEEAARVARVSGESGRPSNEGGGSA